MTTDQDAGAEPSAHTRGQRFGRYRLTELLGSGGFAQVWEAENLETGRRVALKVLTELRAESAEASERFRREGRLAASLNHNRCVYVFGAEEIDGFPTISMELMPGGTLQDLLGDGSLGIEQAVEYVLDIIEGLEAAHTNGIVHRDIKPSNCFLDQAGRAKVGDFGISKSLREESALSATGSFIGTPYYASPEQISGEKVDFRTDLYSVGALLYKLIAGVPPFVGNNPSQVLAHVMTKEAVPLSKHRPTVPKALERVVARLLAKDREKRYQSYGQLRTALMPFSAKGLTAGGLAKRFGAIVLDFALFAPINMLVGFILLGGGVSLAVGSVVPLGIFLTYFTLLEGLNGRSLGKWLLGLRVTTADGMPPTLRDAFVRSLIFMLIYAGPGTVYRWAIGAGHIPQPMTLISSGLPVVLAGIFLASTMRRGNGFAGVHEILSRTRVVLVPVSRHAIEVPDIELCRASTGTDQQFGPYGKSGAIWQRGGEALIGSHDDELDRPVWIHRYDTAFDAPPLSRLSANRAGQLPWLQRGATAGARWDAYGAPGGVSFPDWVTTHGPLSWLEMREIILSTATELRGRFEDEGRGGRLSLHHIWIDRFGIVTLLDFPVRSELPPEDPEREITPDNWQGYLREILFFGLVGRAAAGAPDEHVPQVPVPEYARAVVARLWDDVSGFATVDDLIVELERLAARPARIGQVRRLGPVATLALLTALFSTIVLALPLAVARMPDLLSEFLFPLESYVEALEKYDRAEGASATQTAEAIRIVLAAGYAELRTNEPLARQLASTWPAKTRDVLDSALAAYPAPTEEQVTRARQIVRAQLGGGVSTLGRDPVSVRLSDGLETGFMLLMPFGVLGVVISFAIRGGLLLHLFGMAVQTSRGERAGRILCLGRSLIGWSPLLLILLTPDAFQLPLIAVALAGVSYTVFHPIRGIADRVVGTAVVPR